MSTLETFNNDPKAFNNQLIAQFRANGGKVEGFNRLMLLTTTGAKSGAPRTTPLGYAVVDDQLALLASAMGAPKHPDWYHNLVAHPEVTVEVGEEKYQARAVVPTGADRDRLRAAMIAQLPFIPAHEAKTTRQIPLILLEKIG